MKRKKREKNKRTHYKQTNATRSMNDRFWQKLHFEWFCLFIYLFVSLSEFTFESERDRDLVYRKIRKTEDKNGKNFFGKKMKMQKV